MWDVDTASVGVTAAVYRSILYGIRQYRSEENPRDAYMESSCSRVSCLYASLMFGTLLFATLFPITPGR